MRTPVASVSPADTLVLIGSPVKALGNGRIGGHLVLFGSADEADLEGDYFTAATDFGLDVAAKSAVLYHHGLDPTLGARKLGIGELKVDEAGVWIEAQLELRDEYEKRIYAAVEAGKMGWSSGSAPHLIRRRKGANGKSEITAWPLGLDASITPTPAEPRTRVVALKALIGEGMAGHCHVEIDKNYPAGDEAAPRYALRMRTSRWPVAIVGDDQCSEHSVTLPAQGGEVEGADRAVLEAVLAELDETTAAVRAYLAGSEPKADDAEDEPPADGADGEPVDDDKRLNPDRYPKSDDAALKLDALIADVKLSTLLDTLLVAG